MAFHGESMRALQDRRQGPAVADRLDRGRFDGPEARPRPDGRAAIGDSEAAVAGIPRAKRLIRLGAERILPNGPRCIPRTGAGAPAGDVARAGQAPPAPARTSGYRARDLFDGPG